MPEIPTCHPGDYRRGRGILWEDLAVGEVFHIVGRVKTRTYVKSCPDHAVAIASLPYSTHASEADAELLRMDCARDHVLEGLHHLQWCLANFEEGTRVRPVGRRLFVPDAEAEANWKALQEEVAKMVARSSGTPPTA